MVRLEYIGVPPTITVVVAVAADVPDDVLSSVIEVDAFAPDDAGDMEVLVLGDALVSIRSFAVVWHPAKPSATTAAYGK
jgi:hypothetical protein